MNQQFLDTISNHNLDFFLGCKSALQFLFFSSGYILYFCICLGAYLTKNKAKREILINLIFELYSSRLMMRVTWLCKDFHSKKKLKENKTKNFQFL